MLSRHVLITGGSRGIGAAVAARMVKDGYRVTICSRNPESLAKMVDQLGGAEFCRPVTMDVADAGSIAAGFELVRAGFGPVDILVNNAGQAVSAPFRDTTPAMLDQMMAVNLGGAFHCIQEVLPGMLSRGWGQIINVASSAGLSGFAYASAYCASKHALVGLTRALALEVSGKGVTLNAVCPGFVDTEMARESARAIMAKSRRSEAEILDSFAAMNKLKRLLTPEDVADEVCRLVSLADVNGEASAL